MTPGRGTEYRERAFLPLTPALSRKGRGRRMGEREHMSRRHSISGIPPFSGIRPSQPRVGIWLMPDNASTGELEDFVMQLIPEDDSVWPLSKQYIGEIPQADRKFREDKTRRAEL